MRLQAGWSWQCRACRPQCAGSGSGGRGSSHVAALSLVANCVARPASSHGCRQEDLFGQLGGVALEIQAGHAGCLAQAESLETNSGRLFAKSV
eukprot:2356394-Pleurochrysis_carterae.AAC.1